MNTTCCEKCEYAHKYSQNLICVCPCHQSAENEFPSEVFGARISYAHIADTAEKKYQKQIAEINNIDLYGQSPTTDTSDWRARFDTKFVKLSGPAGLPIEWISIEGTQVQELKAFIEKELGKAWEEGQRVKPISAFANGVAAEQSRIIALAEEMKENYAVTFLDTVSIGDVDQQFGWRVALATLISKIKERN